MDVINPTSSPNVVLGSEYFNPPNNIIILSNNADFRVFKSFNIYLGAYTLMLQFLSMESSWVIEWYTERVLGYYRGKC